MVIDRVWLKQSLRTRQGIAGALTALMPAFLVLGRGPADVATSIVALLFLGDCLIRKNWGWAKTPWIAATLLLWGYSVLRACFIPNGSGDIFAAFVWLRYIFFAASAATWALEDRRWSSFLVRIIIAGVVFLSLDAILQYATGFDIIGKPIQYDGTRLTSIYSHPIVGITIANMFAPALFWLLDKKRPCASIAFGGLAFVTVLLSGERMALLFGVCIMLLWFFALLRTNKKFWPVLVISVCALAALTTLRFELFQRQVMSTTKVIENVAASPYGLAWTSGLHVGEAYPMFGVGMRQFRDACKEERFGPLVDAATNYPRCYVHPHNIYIEWFAEEGLIGLAGFVGFVVFLLAALSRQIRLYPQNMLLWGLAVTIIIRVMPFFASTSFFNNWSAIPFWLCVGWAMQKGLPVSKNKTVT